MNEFSRRHFLLASGLAVGAASTLAACNTAPSGGGKTGSGGVSWWDHFNPLRDLHESVFKAYQKDSGVPVEHTVHQAAKMGQALQLAKQSDQLPDVHSNAGLSALPLPALIKQGWYQPMQLPQEAVDRIGADALIEGITKFDGKIYSFPIFSPRQYIGANWFNKDLVAKAGLDPKDPPETYDEFRAAARAVQQKGGGKVYGWILGLGQPDRLREQTGFLAQAAGFEGFGSTGLKYRTGEIAYHDDAYVHVVEFMLSLQKDGLLVPGTESFNDKVARARWATGVCGYYFDGPWCPGVVTQDLDQFADKLAVGPMLVPEKGMAVATYRPPQSGAFWLSKSSKQPEKASKLLAELTKPDYFVGLAENMDQPPADLSVLDRAELHPAYKRVMELFEGTCFIGPDPVIKNSDVAKVQQEAKPLSPDLGGTVQGLFSGQLKDVRKALKQLSDRSEKDRERSLAVAKKGGAKVSIDDYAFPNWRPRADYTTDMYSA